jgi:hypothetical protein
VLSQHPPIGCFAQGTRPLRRERADVLGDFLTTTGDQDFSARFEEQVNTFPGVCNKASAGAGCFKNACRG